MTPPPRATSSGRTDHREAGKREQIMSALALANVIRLARTSLKHDVASGERTVPEILTDPPDCIRTLRLVDLLMWQHRWGIQRAQRLLRTVRISERRTVASLTPRERLLVARVLEGGGAEDVRAA